MGHSIALLLGATWIDCEWGDDILCFLKAFLQVAYTASAGRQYPVQFAEMIAQSLLRRRALLDKINLPGH